MARFNPDPAMPDVCPVCGQINEDLRDYCARCGYCFNQKLTVGDYLIGVTVFAVIILGVLYLATGGV